MPHVVYVDLSAKVEHWTKTTIVARSNESSITLLVSSRTEQQLRRFLAEHHGRRSLQFRVFAVCIYLVVRDELQQIRQVVVDQDYSGHHAEAAI